VRTLLISLFLLATPALAKEVAFTFDDVPFESTPHYESNQRTEELIRKLNELELPPALIFANPCKGKDEKSTFEQLAKYREAGHLLGNHTCDHPRFDDTSFEDFTANVKRADQLLSPLFTGQKFFRFPFLNEGTDVGARNKMRVWLQQHGYRNGMVSADNEDQAFSAQVNQAKKLGKRIDYEKVRELFLEHIVSSLECDEKLAVKTLGRSPKHVMLLHERDVTVMFIEELTAELRNRGWKIISAADAYQDKMYLEQPQNTFAGYGIVSQLAFEKTGEKTVCYDFKAVKAKLNKVLGL
jgi:peptidoglycan-N-acetylglucosamine deacetylase